MSAFLLPEEIWLQVIGYLSMSDKSNARLCCQYFKRLVDHPSLWVDEVVVLRKVMSYRPHYWETLRCRKLKHVVINATPKGCKQIVTTLPWLRSVTLHLDGSSRGTKSVPGADTSVLADLCRLKQLEKLVIRYFSTSKGIRQYLPLMPQLQHLTVCQFHQASRSDILSGISQLHNLTSLHYHEGRCCIPKHDFHQMLKSLPKLKHLSIKWWPFFEYEPYLPDDYLNPFVETLNSSDPPSVGSSLVSLEVFQYQDPALSPQAFKGFPLLESLAILYLGNTPGSSGRLLTHWLESLPGLKELTIVHGPPLSSYVGTLPLALRKLTLTGIRMCTDTMATAAQRVPDLLELQCDGLLLTPDGTFVGIARLFPKLHTLHVWWGRRDLINISSPAHEVLKKQLHLRRLVVHRAPTPAISQVMTQFQYLTQRGLQVVFATDKTNPANCFCATASTVAKANH